jgi:dTDP-4-dehydrorhamnose 3,5-epimerase
MRQAILIMIFTKTKLQGAFIIEPERFEDERGFFAPCWSEREIAARGLEPRLVEWNVCFNKKKGTLRGMHYQAHPHWQVKIVRVTSGAIYDCIIDLRPNSPTFRQWVSFELTAQNGLMLYIPKGFVHGFQSLSDNVEVFYQTSEVYAPESSCGIRWNDPAFGIEWPLPVSVINARDDSYKDFDHALLCTLKESSMKDIRGAAIKAPF